MRRGAYVGGQRGGHAVPDGVVCPGCRHPGRLHNAYGCVHAECECPLDRDGGQPVAEPPAAGPSGAQVDALDPPCARCVHRRGRHAVLGTGLPCRDCSCPCFATEALNAVAAPAGPAPAMAATPAGPPADAEAAPDGAAGATGATARAGFGLKTPRRQNPRPAAERALVPAAVVGGDDADEEVAADVGARAATSLEQAAAVPRAATAPEPPATRNPVAGMGGGGPVSATPALDLVRLRALAIDVYEAWLCPTCHTRRHDRKRCCKRRLEPIWVAVYPREASA